MNNLFGGGLLIKIVALINLVATGLLTGGEPYTFYGQMLMGLGSALGFMIARQSNVSSEQAGAGIIPPTAIRSGVK